MPSNSTSVEVFSYIQLIQLIFFSFQIIASGISKDRLIERLLRHANEEATPQVALDKVLGDAVTIGTGSSKVEQLPANYGHYLSQFPIIDKLDKLEAVTHYRIKSKGWVSTAIIKVYWTGILNAWVLRQQVQHQEFPLKAMFEDVANMFINMGNTD